MHSISLKLWLQRKSGLRIADLIWRNGEFLLSIAEGTCKDNPRVTKEATLEMIMKFGFKAKQ